MHEQEVDVVKAKGFQADLRRAQEIRLLAFSSVTFVVTNNSPREIPLARMPSPTRY
jgi:hypothetical protein